MTTNGAVTFVGNALGLNKDGTNDRPGASGSLGTFITTDTSQQDNPEWPQGTTGDWRLNSSSAVLSLPSGSRIIHAELIWGGSYLFGSEDVSDFLNDPINFTTPAGTTQVTRDPTTAVTRSGPQQNSYVRTANVTALVSAAGSGTYTVGRVPATQATDEANFNSAGWTLAILYENAGLPTRSLSLFVGLEPQGGATASVSGICTPDNNGKLRARVAVSASGGDTPDPGNTRDSLRFGPSSNLSPDEFRLSGPNNPAENFFASQINRDDGKLDTRGTFGDRNNDFTGTFAGGRQGWDITNVDASPELTRQQTAAFAQGTADGDDFFITALAMQIDVVAPSFGAEGATSVNNPTAQVGDVLTYTVELDNKSGAADANDVVLTVPLPAGMSFVAGSFRLDGTATGANPITGAAIGTVAANSESRGDVPASGGCHSSCAGARSIPGHADVDVHVRGLRRPDTAVGLFDLEHGDHGDCAHHRRQVSFGTIDSARGDPDVHDRDFELRHGGKPRHPRHRRHSNGYDLSAQYDNAQRSRGR